MVEKLFKKFISKTNDIAKIKVTWNGVFFGSQCIVCIANASSFAIIRISLCRYDIE